MSDSTVTQQVASGNSPQPATEVAEQSNYQQVEDEVLDTMGDEDLGEEAGAEDTEAAIDAAQKSGDISKDEANALKRKLKLKVDGEEFEEEIDLNDEDNLKKHLQKSKAFDKRVKEFSTYKSQVDQLIEMLEKDPESVLERMGVDVDSLSKKRIERKIEEMKKSPEQIEKERMEKELEELRAEKKKAKESADKAELERMRNEQAQQIETDITSALESAKSILPKKNPLVLQRISATMLLAMKNGYPDVTAKDVIPLVEKQWQAELNELFSALPEESIEKLVGDKNIDRLRKRRIQQKRAETVTAKQVANQSVGKRVEEETPKKPLRMRDFFKD